MTTEGAQATLYE